MIIRCIGKYPGMTAGQLATHFHLDPGTVSAAIDRLEEKSLVERRRTERDRRRVMLGLTAEGRAVDAAVVGPAERAFSDLLEKAESADVASTHRVLALLAELVESALERDRPE
jgi:DNA-binding MarR family transcriptional regulator